MGIGLNQRREKIILSLLGCREPLTVDDLARIVGASPRTVRYDLDVAAEWLDLRGVSLVRRPGVGAWIEADGPTVARIRRELTPRVDYEYRLSREERVYLILNWLLQSRTDVPARALADRLFVGRNTVTEDLDEAGTWLEQRSLRLVRTRRRGLGIEGEEIKRREALADLLAMARFRYGLAGLGEVTMAGLGRPEPVAPDARTLADQAVAFLRGIDFDVIHQLVAEVADEAGHQLSGDALNGLTLHLAVALARIRDGQDISLPGSQMEFLKVRKEYSVAQAIARALEAKCQINIPAAEEGYIALHLLGARGVPEVTLSGIGTGEEIASETVALAREFAIRAEALLGIRLGQDEAFLMGLALHLEPTAHRLRFGLTLRNPLLSEIKDRYPMLYAVARHACRFMSWHFGRELPDEEIGYLAIHLGAAVERGRSQDKTIRALLVCGSGVGTAQLLRSFLATHLPEVAVIGTCLAFDVAARSSDLNPDCIISTIPLTSSEVPVYRVSALPRAEELAQLRVTLGLPGIRASRPLLGGAETETTAPGRGKHRHRGGLRPVLADVLTPETIQLDATAGDWREAIRLAGQLLVDRGDATPEYIDAMIRTVEELGPYMVIAPGIALAHARPGQGVRRVCLSLVRLRNPVSFGNPDNDPVDLVFALGGIDHNSHLDVLAQLTQLLSDEKQVSLIREAQETEIVCRLARECSAKRAGARGGESN